MTREEILKKISASGGLKGLSRKEKKECVEYALKDTFGEHPAELEHICSYLINQDGIMHYYYCKRFDKVVVKCESVAPLVDNHITGENIH